MEKWTAADERLWAALDQRRTRRRHGLRGELYRACLPLVRTNAMSDFIDSLIENAASVSRALEPYVLLLEEDDDE